jgi:hypothetical protein
MKKPAHILSLAISVIAVSSDITPASASRMNGKCCQSSDGGRSYRYRVALRRAAMPRTCTAFAASCTRGRSAREDGPRLCQAARAQCLGTGVYVGPYSGWQFAGMRRI